MSVIVSNILFLFKGKEIFCTVLTPKGLFNYINTITCKLLDILFYHMKKAKILFLLFQEIKYGFRYPISRFN